MAVFQHPNTDAQAFKSRPDCDMQPAQNNVKLN